MTGKTQELHKWKNFCLLKPAATEKNVPLFVAIIERVQVFELVTNMGSCLVCVPMYCRSKNFCAALR